MKKREEEQIYKNQLMVAYAKQFLEHRHKNDGVLGSKIDLDNLSEFDSVRKLVFEQEDLESLLDCYLFAAGNEKIGVHENIMGNVKEGISGTIFPTKEVSELYHTFKGILFRQMENIFEFLDDDVRNKFLDEILPKKEDMLKEASLASKNKLLRYEFLKDEITEKYMVEYGLTHDQAFVQFVNLENYDGRLGVIADAGIESISSLRDALENNIKSNVK